MKSHSGIPKIRLTREGWIFLVILAFVSVGAVLRNINLLIILSGMMIAPLLLSWRISLKMLRDLEVDRTLPWWVHARKVVDVEWQCENLRESTPTWTLNIKDQIRSVEESSKNSKKSKNIVHAIIPQIDPGEVEFASYRCLFPQRGVYQVGPARLSSRFPLGLIAAHFSHDSIEQCHVAPMLGELSPSWERWLQSKVTGVQAQRRQRGMEEEEFFALRQWRSGDSSRQIHWRSSAKAGEPMIKQFEQKSDRDFALAIDLHALSIDGETSLATDASEREAVEKALSFAATVGAKLSQTVQGKIAFAVCGRESAFHADQMNREWVGSTMRALSVAQPAAETQLGSGLLRLYGEVSTGTPILVVSTRPQPDLQQLLMESGSGADSRNAAGISMVESWVRWLQVDSKEFLSLFSLPNQARVSTRPNVIEESKHVTS